MPPGAKGPGWVQDRLLKPVKASSIESASHKAEFINDGRPNPLTRWSTHYENDQWLVVDLGKEYEIGRIVIEWEVAYGRHYQILVSGDTENWRMVYEQKEGKGGREELTFDPVLSHTAIPGTAANRRGTGRARFPFGTGKPTGRLLLSKVKTGFRRGPANTSKFKDGNLNSPPSLLSRAKTLFKKYILGNRRERRIPRPWTSSP